MRWDLVTRFEVLKKGEPACRLPAGRQGEAGYSRAFKSYSGEEDLFKEHLPGKPRVPQVFFIEMIAQAGGVLFGLGLGFKKEIILAKIEDAEFFLEAAPPCEFLIEARIEDAREDGAWISGVVTQNGRTVAQAKILLAVVDELAPGKTNIVFNQAFMKKYNVLEIASKSENSGACVL